MNMKFLLLCCLMFFSSIVSAQLCTGSLGDPVVNIDFGAGTAVRGTALSAGITNYTYVAGSFPQDGSYTIENTSAGTGGIWWTTTDHTGNAGGYMMVVNASASLTDYFYKQTVTGLCENTTYEFASWIMNLTGANRTDNSPPNITFSIERTNGQVLGTYTTGLIPQTSAPIWKQFGFFFKTPAGVSDLVIRMTNKSPGGIGNDLALDDITFRACGPDVKANIDVTGNPSTLSVCAGTTNRIIANVSSGYDHLTYQWQENTSGTGWTDIPGGTAASLTVQNSLAGVHQYRLAVGEGVVSARCRVVSDIVTITVKGLPTITATNNGPLCVGSSVSLIAGDGGTSYSWSGPNGYTANTQTAVIGNAALTTAGTYTVTATTAEGCTVTASTEVLIGSRPVAVVSGDISICEGTSTTLLASGGQSYLWLPATGLSDNKVANPIASPTVNTTYTVTVTDHAYSCPSNATVVVKVLKDATANAGSDQIIIKGNSAQLAGVVSGDNISYYWTPTDYLNNATLLNPVSTPERSTTYTLHVLSDAGCLSAVDQVIITVNEKVAIPNTFSPNGDGYNDVWNIGGLSNYTKAKVAIFNRNGSPVYKSTGYAIPWNGTNNGSELPVGTYYYVIDLNNGTPAMSGWIWLTR